MRAGAVTARRRSHPRSVGAVRRGAAANRPGAGAPGAAEILDGGQEGGRVGRAGHSGGLGVDAVADVGVVAAEFLRELDQLRELAVVEDRARSGLGFLRLSQEDKAKSLLPQ